jgi:hypothetical protein
MGRPTFQSAFDSRDRDRPAGTRFHDGSGALEVPHARDHPQEVLEFTEESLREEPAPQAPRRRRKPVDTVMLCLYGIGAVMAGFLVWWSLTVMT